MRPLPHSPAGCRFHRRGAFAWIALGLIVAAGPASAVLVTLTSPDGKWSLSSDEYGSYGEAVPGSFARRDFGTGLTGYSWASGVLVTDGTTRQWLTSDAGFGFANVSAIGRDNVISDGAGPNTRVSEFMVPGFAGLQVNLWQGVNDSGLTQQYTLKNTSPATINLSVIAFHDVDLDASTFIGNTIIGAGIHVSVTEGTRSVTFGGGDAVGFGGFLAGHVPGGGISGSLDAIAYANFGIPPANRGEFRDVSGGVIGADLDLDKNHVSDSPADVGYLFQRRVATLAPGESVFAHFSTFVFDVPEPEAASLALLGSLVLLSRRRKQI